MDDLDLNLLLALEALFEEQNVTRAARRLHITQPAMSHALQRLRDTWRDPLFVRSTKGITPTARALSLEPMLKKALTEVRTMLADEQFDPAKSRRRFTLATPDFGQVLILPELLRRIRAEAPEVTVSAWSRPTDFLAQLESGALDVLLGAESETDLPASFRRQVALRTRPVVVAHRRHPQLRRPLTLEAFAKLPHVQLTFRRGLTHQVDAMLTEAGLTPNIALEMSDLIAAMFVAAETDLVVIAGDLIADTVSRALPLRGFPIPGLAAARPIFQIWHERSHRDPAHAWFRAEIHSVAARLGESARRRSYR